MQDGLNVPVAFIIFNRLDTTKRVFERIRQARPTKLYLISDGYRESVPGEKEIVDEVRQYVESSIDWECTILKNYAEKNIGCGKRICTGLDWVFDNEEMAIILEDDCLPTISFFDYCTQLLEKYKDNEQIMLVSGNNPIASKCECDFTYSFNKIPFIWGWASWARAWHHFDFTIADWPSKRKSTCWRDVFTKKAYRYYMSEFDVLYKQKFNIWDYQMVYAVISNDMLCVVPSENHVVNLGFDENATNTTTPPEWVDSSCTEIQFPIKHPLKIEWNQKLDHKYMDCACWNGNIVYIKKILGLDINKKYF